MDNLDNKLSAALKALPHASQVALCCVAIEHVIDLYRLGNLKLQVKDVPKVGAKAPKESDVVDHGLELAWSFVTEGKHDAATAKAIAKALKARPFVSESEEFSVPSNGPLIGLAEALAAIDDKTAKAADMAVTRAAIGVSRMVAYIDRKNQQASVIQKYAEVAWQLKVATLLQAHGDKPIAHAMFEKLLAEELPWRKHLKAYEERWSGQGAAAAAPPKAKKPATKAKPAAKTKKAGKKS